MHDYNTRSRQGGVGLIELLVSVLVLSVGLVALARLQIELVRGAADSRARSAAVALAEQKLEDLRSYGVIDGAGAWSPTASPQAWSWIDDNAGGRIAAQTQELEGVRYTLSWAVSDITYTSSLGPAAGIPTDYKDVTVTVAWQDERGDTQQVQLTGSIMDIPPGNVIAASQPVTARPPGPDILYQPGVAPEIISVPIEVGGGRRRETTKPLPDVVGRSGTHLVRFDVVNYRAAGGEFIVDKREEFITVNCPCSVGSAGPARTPARAVFQNGILRDVPGLVRSKPRGSYTATGSSFDDVCVTCCRDHFDYSEAGTNYFYDPTDSTAHQHYRRSGSGPFTFTQVSSGTYEEACRLKRVNGVFQVFEDWNLRDLTVLPGAFLTDTTTQQQYVDYVQDAVEAVVTGGSLPAKPSGRDTTIASGQFNQLFGRALYVDLPAGLATYISDALTADPGKTFADFLDIVPFYEINLTKLADWASVGGTNIVRTTSSDVKDEGEDQDEYSRGRAEGEAPASNPPANVRVLASLKPANTGVTGTPAIRPDEDDVHPRAAPVTAGSGQNIRKYFATAIDPTTESPAPTEHRDDSIIVAFSGTAPPPPPPVCDPDCPPPPPPPPAPAVAVSGDLLKWDGATGNNKPHTQVTGVTFSGSASGTCTLNKNGNNVHFSCLVPNGWTGDITFAPSSLSYCTASSCAAGTVLSGDQRVYTAPVRTGLGDEDTWVMN